jgi:UDP-glucuronate decarboxylase
VDDIVDGFIRLTNSSDDLTGPVNLENTEEIAILELADKIIKLAASRSEIIFKPPPADDPRQRKPDITLAKEKLGWSPRRPGRWV